MIHFFPCFQKRKKARGEEMVQILDFRVIRKVTLSSALTLTLQPLFHPQFECILKTSKNKLGYSFIKLGISSADLQVSLWRSLNFTKNMSQLQSRRRKGLPDPKPGKSSKDRFRWSVWSNVFGFPMYCFHPDFSFSYLGPSFVKNRDEMGSWDEDDSTQDLFLKREPN